MDDTPASDTDRERTVEHLRTAVGAGQLDLTAFDERLRYVYEARTEVELAAITADLTAATSRPAEVGGPGGDERVHPWRTWVATSILMIGIWILASVAVGHPTYFWPFWPIGGWGLAVAAAAIGGGRARRSCR